MTRHAAIYCRLSPRPDGSYEGIPAQKRWGRAYAAATWPGVPVEVFADEGISAANDHHRPEFERFRQWLADGRIGYVWCVEQTRMERREVEWFRLASEMDAAGVGELHTNRDGIVRVRDEVAGIKAVLAAGEVRKLKRRINDRLAENAANGTPPGGKPFGYVRGHNAEGAKTYLIVPEEAAVVREAAERVLSGWSLSNIAKDLTERGFSGARGGAIRLNTVRSFLTTPTIAGHRVHSGAIVGRGNWEAILDDETWQAVRLKLSQPRTVARSDGGTYAVSDAHKGNTTGRRYVLTGLAKCEVCKAPLVGTLRRFAPKADGSCVVAPYLMCHPNRGGKGCVGIMMEPTDEFVLRELWAELDKPEFLEHLAADAHAAERKRLTSAMSAIETQRGQLAALWAQPGELTMGEWQAARKGLTEQEQEIRAELAKVPPPVVNVDITGARAAWPAMTLDEQREFMRLFIDKVIVSRAKEGNSRFDSDRVDIMWLKR